MDDAGRAVGLIQLDLVPLRDPTLAPEEILMSESQERMMAVVEPDKLDAFLDVCRKWDVLATVIGTVTDSGRLRNASDGIFRQGSAVLVVTPSDVGWRVRGDAQHWPERLTGAMAG